MKSCMPSSSSTKPLRAGIDHARATQHGELARRIRKRLTRRRERVRKSFAQIGHAGVARARDA